MAKTALQVQAEARWTLSKRWGVVAFAGAGDVKDPITADPEDSFVPSYGAGIRAVPAAQRPGGLRALQ
jgi:hypothetical protein